MLEKIVKIGIVGTGNRGIDCFGMHLKEYANAEVVALYDPNAVRMQLAAKTFSRKPHLYQSLEQMLDNEELDAVIITSPDYCHTENAVTVLNQGINVLIDKPLATTVQGCQQILQAAKQSKKTVMIGFNLRHEPTLKRLKQIIDEGMLGKIFMIENREFYDGGKTYMSRWNRKYALSGGLWVHKGSHDFDVFNWLLDFPKAIKVSASASVNVLNKQNIPFEVEKGKPVGPTCTKCAYKNSCPDRYEIIEEKSEWNDDAAKIDGYNKDLCMYLSDKDTHDNGMMIVEYENGIRASHLECFVTSLTDRLYTVVGDRGQAEVSLHNRRITIRPRWSQEVITYNIPAVPGGHGGADPGLIEEFLNIISGTSNNTSTAEHGMLSTAIGQAAEISVRENRMVTIEELSSIPRNL